jgi:adenine-specific DNA-methyltransferase
VSIIIKKTGSHSGDFIEPVNDFVIWYSKNKSNTKVRKLYDRRAWKFNDNDGFRNIEKQNGEIKKVNEDTIFNENELVRNDPILSSGHRETTSCVITLNGKNYDSGFNYNWKVHPNLVHRLLKANRLAFSSKSVYYKRKFGDFPVKGRTNIWDLGGASDMIYIVQTNIEIVKRCILMSTDPGDLILDPTCGSGTTATVSEQWGRRWITIDTSRVAIALARARIMGARYPYYLLADSRDGQDKEAEINRQAPSTQQVHGNIRYGFVCEHVPHITLKSVASNNEIDVIWDRWQVIIYSLLDNLNKLNKSKYEDYEVPIEADPLWIDEVKKIHFEFCKARINRQLEIDNSISAKTEFECLYDRPYEDKSKVRVAGPFTVESLSPHRVMAVDENDNLIDSFRDFDEIPKQSFVQMILENLKVSGVQQSQKKDKIQFNFLTPWPGNLVCAEGKYFEGPNVNGDEKRAAIFIGPEFGTVQKADLVQAAREAGDAGFDVLIACAFNYDAHATELNNLGRIPILKARMNADLHMSEDLKNTGKGNLFVIFGEPDIDVIEEANEKIRIKVNGVDVFKPQTGEVVSDGADGIACWFIDTDYNEESFFVRQAYFLGANDPYSSLKTTLKVEINFDAWATLNSDISRAFPKPKSGRIAVKVINHLGDEVMKVFKV